MLLFTFPVIGINNELLQTYLCCLNYYDNWVVMKMTDIQHGLHHVATLTDFDPYDDHYHDCVDWCRVAVATRRHDYAYWYRVAGAGHRHDYVADRSCRHHGDVGRRSSTTVNDSWPMNCDRQ